MTAAVAAEPQPRPTEDDDYGITHLTLCHDENRSLCGLDITGEPWVPDGLEEMCVVCADLEEIHCGCDCGCCDEAAE